MTSLKIQDNVFLENNFCLLNREWVKQWKCLSFMAIEFFASQFSKFYENQVKHDKNDFKRGLIMTSKVKSS